MTRKYYIEHRDDILKEKREYYQKNKEQIKFKNIIYNKNNAIKLKERDNIYYIKNRESILKSKKEYYLKTKTHKQDYDKQYRLKNKQQITNRFKLYYQQNKTILNKKGCEYVKNRLKTDINFKLLSLLRDRISKAIKDQYGKKAYRSIELLGCSIEEARSHLELQFKPGMSWQNHGTNGWHIDHIKPCSVFDLTNPQQQKECFHYTNLQPLWAKENLSKGDKIF